ncbi:MAG: BTAD domain-containing putative transcriptional regulator [Chromatiales bacterium]
MSQWIERLETCLARHPAFPSVEIEALVIGSMQPLMLHRPEHPLCRRFAERAWALLTQPIDPPQAVPLANTALFYCVITGECARAKQIVDSLSPRIMEARVSPLAMITWRTMEAIQGWHTADHELAFRAVDAALAQSRESGVHVLDLAVYAQGVYAALSAGDMDRAERFLAPMRPLLDPRRPMDLGHYELLQVGLAITRGEGAQFLPAARRNLESSQALGNAMGGEVVGRLSLVVVLMELGEHAEARREIAKMRRFAAKMRSHWLAYNALILEANSYFLTGEEHEGLTRLREALTLGRTQGFSNCHPWWQPKVMARLCAKALQAGIEVGYVKHLIKHRALAPDSLDNKHWPWPIKVYALGHFEMLIDDTPIPATDRKRHKPLELLRVLIALGGRPIPVGEIADVLWRDAEGDAGYRALITNLNRLRALLHHKDAIEITGKCLSINLAHVWVDAWAFERLLVQAAAQARKGGDSARASALREQALELYRGPFLDAASGAWAIPRRDRLRARYVQHLDAAARELETAKRAGLLSTGNR